VDDPDRKVIETEARRILGEKVFIEDRADPGLVYTVKTKEPRPCSLKKPKDTTILTRDKAFAGKRNVGAPISCRSRRVHVDASMDPIQRTDQQKSEAWSDMKFIDYSHRRNSQSKESGSVEKSQLAPRDYIEFAPRSFRPFIQTISNLLPGTGKMDKISQCGSTSTGVPVDFYGLPGLRGQAEGNRTWNMTKAEHDR
jgi:hypothetical protein